MRGLFLNCNGAEKAILDEKVSESNKVFYFPPDIGCGYVVYDSHFWQEPPIEFVDDNVFVISGWFVYKEKLNPLALLAKDILEKGPSVLNNILAGVFLLFWKKAEQQILITDCLGLSTHYIDKKDDNLRVAPYVNALVKDKHDLNPKMQSVLTKKGHLFGNFTVFDGIERLPPGSILSTNFEESYFELYPPKPIAELGQNINDLMQFWEFNERILPLSSGLDSRLLLANGSYTYGFTYGPDNSPEREIARSFRNDFQHYHDFDFNEQPLHNQEKQVVNKLASGVIKPINRLFTNYEYVSGYYPNAKVFFDGYLGDLFQRGTYINFKGKRGELLKLFPFTYSFFNFKAKTLIKLRYKELSTDEFDILWKDFIDKTSALSLNDYQKVTYYEFLYGRGGRYTIFGSNVLAAQFFCVVSPFTARGIFDSFIQQDYKKAVSYKSLKEIWKKTASKYKNTPVESGYKPTTYPVLIPFIQLIYRIMFHLIPSRANYGVKMKREK